jgi:hypothetical protein
VTSLGVQSRQHRKVHQANPLPQVLLASLQLI